MFNRMSQEKKVDEKIDKKERYKEIAFFLSYLQ